MATPSLKSAKIETFLDALSGRSTAIKNNKCVDPPIGCGKSITEFKSDIAAKEYRISGLCQECHDPPDEALDK